MASTYYAVDIGIRPGLYTNFSDVRVQAIHSPDGTLARVEERIYKRRLSRASAMDFLEQSGIKRSEMRLFIRVFPEFPGMNNFRPRHLAPFDSEFRRFAEARDLKRGSRQEREAKIDALYKELIYHYLPEGLMLHQVDDVTGDIRLTKDQTLRIYQEICAQSGKPVRASIIACIKQLKCKAPYVDLIELVDCFRTREKIRTFHRWQDLCDFTRNHPIDVKRAMENDLLSPLLHNLSRGPPKSLSQACRRWLGNRKYAPCEPEQDSHIESRDASREQTPIIKEEPTMLDMSNCTLSDFSSSALSNELDTPLGSPEPDCFSYPPFSPPPVGGPPGFRYHSESTGCAIWSYTAPRSPPECSDSASQTASEESGDDSAPTSSSERTFYSALASPSKAFQDGDLAWESTSEESEDDDSAPPSPSRVIKNEPLSSPPAPLPLIPLSRRQESSPINPRVKQEPTAAAAVKLGKRGRDMAPSAQAPPAKQRCVKCLKTRRITDFFKPV